MDTTKNRNHKAPHNAQTKKYEAIKQSIVFGFVLLAVVFMITRFIIHININIAHIFVTILVFAAIYYYLLAIKKQEQVRLTSGLIDKEWYDTKTNELSNIANNISSKLNIPKIKVRINLTNSCYACYSIDYESKDLISIAISIVNEFTLSEIEFLLACHLIECKRCRIFNTKTILHTFTCYFLFSTIAFALGYTSIGIYMWMISGIMIPMIRLIGSHDHLQLSIIQLKQILAITKDYESVKSAIVKISGINTSDLTGEELEQYILKQPDIVKLHKAAQELGLIN